MSWIQEPFFVPSIQPFIKWNHFWRKFFFFFLVVFLFCRKIDKNHLRAGWRIETISFHSRMKENLWWTMNEHYRYYWLIQKISPWRFEWYRESTLHQRSIYFVCYFSLTTRGNSPWMSLTSQHKKLRYFEYNVGFRK